MKKDYWCCGTLREVIDRIKCKKVSSNAANENYPEVSNKGGIIRDSKVYIPLQNVLTAYELMPEDLLTDAFIDRVTCNGRKFPVKTLEI
jgi:hypothetical protein